MVSRPSDIAAALAGDSAGGENPCVAAIEAAEKGAKGSEAEGEEPEKKQGVGERDVEGISEPRKGPIKRTGEWLKKLLRK